MQLQFWDNNNPREGSSRERSRGRVIRASEIGEYEYCHRAWWLGRVKGVENANRAALDAGVIRHQTHGRTVQRADSLQRAAVVLVIIAVAIAAVLVAMFLGIGIQ